MTPKDKARTIRLISEVGDMAGWSRDNKNAWYQSWLTDPVVTVKTLEDLWKSWKSNKYGVLKAD